MRHNPPILSSQRCRSFTAETLFSFVWVVLPQREPRWVKAALTSLSDPAESMNEINIPGLHNRVDTPGKIRNVSHLASRRLRIPQEKLE